MDCNLISPPLLCEASARKPSACLITYSEYCTVEASAAKISHQTLSSVEAQGGDSCLQRSEEYLCDASTIFTYTQFYVEKKLQQHDEG
jgi:hypothetical protein